MLMGIGLRALPLCNFYNCLVRLRILFLFTEKKIEARDERQVASIGRNKILTSIGLHSMGPFCHATLLLTWGRQIEWAKPSLGGSICGHWDPW